MITRCRKQNHRSRRPLRSKACVGDTSRLNVTRLAVIGRTPDESFEEGRALGEVGFPRPLSSALSVGDRADSPNESSESPCPGALFRNKHAKAGFRGGYDSTVLRIGSQSHAPSAIHTLTLTHSHSFTHTLSLSHTHTHTLSARTGTFSLTLSFCSSPSLSPSLPLPFSLSLFALPPDHHKQSTHTHQKVDIGPSPRDAEVGATAAWPTSRPSGRYRAIASCRENDRPCSCRSCDFPRAGNGPSGVVVADAPSFCMLHVIKNIGNKTC